VRAAKEPYEGTARFVERPSDLVVLSLAGFRRRDTAFIAAVKKRAPETRILLLVPEGQRHAALDALQAGADAYALEPFYPAELTALAAALVRPREEAPEEDAARALSRLAGEVAHAINNPLQILALLGEAADVSIETRDALGQEVERIQGVMRILARFGLLRRPQRSQEALGLTLRQSLESAERTGRVRIVGPPPADGPAVSVDSSQAGVAFDTMLQFLAASAEDGTVEIAARIRELPASQPVTIEAAVRGHGIHLEPEHLASLCQTVLLNRDDTREPYPGLALADAVARIHGGRFVARSGEHGTTLGLRLPLG